MDRLRQAFPTRALILFLAIGVIDLVVTSILYAQGLITEANPVMAFFIERSNWLFVLVKGLTLVAGWYALNKYAQKNLAFVRKACLYASGAYVFIWLIVFMSRN